MSTYTGPERDVSLEERRSIVARILSPAPLQWEQGGDWSYVECPGKDCHTNGNGRRDCRVYACEAPGRTLKPPGLYCLHSSCAGVLATVNFRIRSEIGKAKASVGRQYGAKGARNTGSTGGSPSNGAPRTARTGSFQPLPKEGEDLRTGRTGIPKPLVRFARAQVRAHSSQDTASEPSGASVVAPPPQQPEQPGGQNAPASAEKIPPVRAPGPEERLECTLVVGQRVERGYWRGNEWVCTKRL